MTPRDTPENPYVAGKLFDLPGSHVRTSGLLKPLMTVDFAHVHGSLLASM